MFTSEPYTANRSGLFVPERIAKRPIAIDLFCGCGGFSLGFIQAGFEVIAGLDSDTWAMVTYLTNLGSYPVNIHWIDPEDKERVNKKIEKAAKRASKNRNGVISPHVSGSGWIKNYPEHTPVSHFFYGDCRKITGQEMLDALGLKQGEVDCVMGGPPCQGFSTAGKREVMDPRNSLVFDFARLVCEIKPKTFVMENVPGILSMVTPEGIPIIDALSLEFEKGEFGTYDAIRNSLLASSGAGIVTKSAKASRRGKAKSNISKEVDSGQMTLDFGGVVNA